jgi:anti-sigma B factor antagonist
MLELEIDSAQCVHLRGRLDAAQAPQAQAFLDRIEVGAAALVVVCTGLEHVSSAGLGVLLKTHKRLLARGGRLCLKGPDPHLREILVYSGFDQILEVLPE